MGGEQLECSCMGEDVIEKDRKEVSCQTVQTVPSCIKTDSQELTDQRLGLTNVMYTIFTSWASSEGFYFFEYHPAVFV
jgi:hypothetical protein